MRILVVEDDETTLRYVVKGLTESGHVVDAAGDGREGLLKALDARHDVIVADRMLPRMDGLAMIREIRGNGNTTPILLLSALAEVDHRVEGLRAGGDDYMVKPFSFAELIARIEALARRHGGDAGEGGPHLAVGDLELDATARTVRRGTVRIDLQPREFRALEFMMRHRDQVVTRAMLLEHLWDYDFEPQSNVVEVLMSRLRGKVDRDFDTLMLHTVRGAGWMLGARPE